MSEPEPEYLTQAQLDEIEKHLETEYEEFEEYYEDDEDRTGTYKRALEQAMKDIRILFKHIAYLDGSD